VAEDHHINRKLCLLMLEECGVTADTANNGAEAIAAITKQRYDLVLMDCNMPEVDGYEATKSIRQLEATRDVGKEERIYIIALTAHVLTGERERCLAMGMDDYLGKPFTAAELRSVLLRALGEQGTSAGTSAGPSVAISRLDQLVNELDRESVASLIEDFIRDLPARVAELEDFIAQANRQEVERTAHSLAGSSASLGLDDLNEMFRTMEEAAAAGDLEDAQRSLAPLKASADAGLMKLRAWLAQEL
jgi:CheY-like chemotaxis protein/HPt (histidine-containing phosphotransfer) domain-containing protein